MFLSYKNIIVGLLYFRMWKVREACSPSKGGYILKVNISSNFLLVSLAL